MNKKNKVNFHSLFFLCLLFISGNMNALLRPTGKIAKARAIALQRYEKKELQKKIAPLKPEEFFVYEEGTSNGVVVSENTIIQCKNISNMLYMTLEFGGNIIRAVPIPYSFDIIKNVFAILKSNKSQVELEKDLNQLTLEQLVIFTNFAVDYLGVAKEKENIFVQALCSRIFPIKYKIDEIHTAVWYYNPGIERGIINRVRPEINEQIETLKQHKEKINSLEKKLSTIPNYNVLRNLTSIPDLNKKFYSAIPEEGIVIEVKAKLYYEMYWGFANTRIDENGVIFIGNDRVTIFEFLERMKNYIAFLLALYKKRIEREILQLEGELEKELGIGEKVYRWFVR